MLSVEHKWLSDFSVCVHVLGIHQAAILSQISFGKYVPGVKRS